MITKKTLLKLAAIALCAACAACAGNKDRKEAAAALVERAQALVEARQCDSAIVVLDTLNVKYRDCLDERRQGTLVRLEALATLTRDSITSSELQLSAASATVDSLAPLFKKVEIPGTAGYFVDKSVYTGSEMNETGIQVRVDDQGYCFVIANVAHRNIGLNKIAYANSVAEGESIAVEGSEIMSITQEKAASLVEAICSATNKAKVTLSGSKGSVEIVLSPKQIQSIRDSWRYALALQQSRLLNIRLEKLERQLSKLSDQKANQTAYPED